MNIACKIHEIKQKKKSKTEKTKENEKNEIERNFTVTRVVLACDISISILYVVL